MDEDEKDRAKRASRNKSEKKRRDQFNVLIKELCTMLQGHGHPLKMDKSTILQRTIDFLQKQKEITAQTESCEVRQDWKPSFLSNEEFTQLMLEALDGFVIALTTDGIIIYVSDSVSSLLGHLPSDLVEQNILNFLPECEQSDVYKLLSPHMLMTNPVATDFLNTEKQIEFCCHLARGNLDPNEPITYEYVKFVVDFKYFTHVPTSSYNGFESAIARVFRSANEEQICLVATVRLVTPQFLKELCNVEEPCEEFTSRHSLEWKFLFLDYRAPPIIGYLPFEVLGTSGYDYYHADDLELLARCHEHLMQFGKGKSCYYRFLTKGQQWIWLQTHYYITYHQWSSKPEFIVCTHTVVSYAEVRAERRRDLGLEESSIELASSSLKSHGSYMDIRHCVTNQEASREGVSVSSHSSRRSSHTALSDSASTSSIRHTDASTSTRQSLPLGQSDKAPLSRASSSSTQGIITPQTPTEHLTQHHMAQTTVPAQQTVMPVYHFPAQIGMMHQLKEQLEERTRILQADIKTQQEELHVIKEQLQLVQDSSLQMLMQQPMPTVFNNVQHQNPRCPSQQQATTVGTRPATSKKSQQQGLMGSKQFCSTHLASPQQFLKDPCVTSSPVQQQQQQQKHAVRGNQVQQACLPMQMSIAMPLYNNPMVFSQAHPITPSTSMPTEIGERQQQSDYNQDQSLRMLLDQSVQPLISSGNGSDQSSQSNTGRQQTKFAQEQQGLPAAIQMQPITCTTICAPTPSPVFTPSVMIPHASIAAQQSHPPGTLHQWQPHQVQQHHLYLQMQGTAEPGQNQHLFQQSHVPQQNTTMGFFHHPQTQSHHLQGQPCGLQDLPEMQLP
ncbi:circadian clock protein PASD1 [Rhineura floridana]|uniref:circadian clock protein PASD1 n=1 Tax=Rhineura floridana TaxID=261503 RepID=UPI002AC80A14|nr:circadian clock protein PASD1 [Rhineura floridana]XP_061454948.1 circadian clock protein PASD1 [Rhineura floridana]XP_061454949.1 circadian clock protein PASD1 [Rhineura floridana]XP_061454950.1 circadian clock protein PASD1 [Rhineura floridana]XP_061454951.1 circadian clock protein PASD1 [Rhineura floridana]XP_061454954.1 circadian clock protein PASD1 [Rhineura floridana]XP_061454955.1 circadian clock protein PASD1 [Rhineura floridana]XP_061454956.1 circadian clock protein PASD1 [Rhineur